MRCKHLRVSVCKAGFNFQGVFITCCHVAVTWPHEPLPAIKADKSLIYRKRRRDGVGQRGNERVIRERGRNNESPVPLHRYFTLSFFVATMLNVIVFGQCSMNCCQWGSLTSTGRDKETDGSRLCGLLWLWPDCTALFTVGGVCVCVCMCAAECTPAQANAFVSWQRKRCRDHTCTTVTSLSPFGFLLMDFLSV